MKKGKNMKKPLPTGVEIKLNPKKFIVSKTDTEGKIIYANDYFTEISGYSEVELIGSPHNILRHPNMPRVIFKLMWHSIQNSKNIKAVVKNLAKDGRHYWIVTDFNIQKDNDGNIKNYIAYRQAASKNIIKDIEPLYKKLQEIESSHGYLKSEEYLTDFLEEKDMNYSQFIDDLAKKKGLSTIFFNSMKKLFS